jgi:hypothetical protein
MTGSKTWLAGVVVLGMLPAAPDLARATQSSHAHASHRTACCRAPAGTVVEVELAEPVSTKTKRAGDSFALRLAQPLVLRNELLLRKGTPGVGTVVTSAGPGFGGKSGKLVLAAQYLQAGGRRIPLQGLQLARHGRNNAMAASAVGLTGMAFAPLGFAGLAIHGGNVDLPEGLEATAKLSHDAVLPPLGRATAPPPLETEEATEQAAIAIPAPPHGKGEVVFFRKRSVLSTFQWFKVRENGKALCKLTNGAYCIVVAAPGSHTYTAKFEPELKDHLTLQIGPGDTYYVEGATSRALLIGAADLMPSDPSTFARASKHLKPGPPIAANGADDARDAGEPSAKAHTAKR